MVKKQNRRSKEKYPALKQNLNLKTRYELIDYDYVDQLSDKEKDWLNRFTEEYTNAKYDHEGPKIQKKKKHELESYGRNNARNRCILTLAKAMGKAHGMDLIKFSEGRMNPEEALLMEEKLRNALTNEKLIKELMKKPKYKKIIEDLRQILREMELMRDDLHRSNDESSNS